MRYLRAALAALFLLPLLAVAEQPFESHAFTVMTKSWVEVPEEYQISYPSWKEYVGTWQSTARNKQKNLYIHSIGRMGWKYGIKDTYGRYYTLYAGQGWTWTPGDKIIVTGTLSAAKVFIPQGERIHG